MIEARLRTQISEEELAAKHGKIVTDSDYNLVLTGPAKLRKPDGSPLAVYLPGALSRFSDELWPNLSSIKMITDNRGAASGTPRERRGDQKRSRTRRIYSGVVGSVDPGPASARTAGRLPACRLTAWTGAHLDQWEALQGLLGAIGGAMAEHVPDRYAAQQAIADRTHPDWVVPGTPFTTLTVNNTYSTGVHTDSGDYAPGFGTLATFRRGPFTGGLIVLARYRVAVDMHDGDLLLFDVHEPHGNTNIMCPHTGAPLRKPDCGGGCQRVSLVAYYRTAMETCPPMAEEHAKVIGSVYQ